MLFRKNDVVQFNENHKWCGCIGIITEIKSCNGDIRYMIGVPVPEKGTAFIFSMDSEHELEYIGEPALVLESCNNEED